MSTGTEPVAILSVGECWSLLESVPIGRVVTAVEGEANIFPVNFAVADRKIFFRTAEGTKLVSVAMSDRVVFEADGYDADEGWSVIIRGVARTLHSEEDLEEARGARLLPWTQEEKPHLVRVSPLRVTGRRFRFGPAPAAQ